MKCSECAVKQRHEQQRQGMRGLITTIDTLNRRLETALIAQEAAIQMAEKWNAKYESLRISMEQTIEKCREIARH